MTMRRCSYEDHRLMEGKVAKEPEEHEHRSALLNERFPTLTLTAGSLRAVYCDPLVAGSAQCHVHTEYSESKTAAALWRPALFWCCLEPPSNPPTMRIRLYINTQLFITQYQCISFISISSIHHIYRQTH